MIIVIIAIIVIPLWTTHIIHIAPDKILDLETSGSTLHNTMVIVQHNGDHIVPLHTLW